jgi:hypothetical protein
MHCALLSETGLKLPKGNALKNGDKLPLLMPLEHSVELLAFYDDGDSSSAISSDKTNYKINLNCSEYHC